VDNLPPAKHAGTLLKDCKRGHCRLSLVFATASCHGAGGSHHHHHRFQINIRIKTEFDLSWKAETIDCKRETNQEKKQGL
jgi:hypothetical protein